MDFADFNQMGGRRRPHTHAAFDDATGGRGHRGGRRHPMSGAGFPPAPPMPPGFGPFDPFGQRRGGGRRARRGDVRLAALLLIAEEPRNGYQIIQELEQRTDGRWKPSPGAIYPALSQLEDEGLIMPVDAESGKAFRITEAGASAAEAAGDRAPWEQTEDEGSHPAHDLMRGFGKLGQAVGAVAQSGNEEAITKAAAELDELRRRIYQILAES